MNNFSAESPTEDTLAFLDEIINEANYYVSIKIKEHEGVFNEAKEHVKELAADDDRLLFSIRDDIHYSHSEFEYWKNSSIWNQLWNTRPADNTEKHRKQCEQKALAKARETITITLDDMLDLQLFYNKTAFSPHYGWPTHYPIGYRLCVRLLADYLPYDMGRECMELTQYKNNLNKIQKMYNSLTVHEFETVTIEENMLKTIELVKANSI